ncbi:glutamate-5-semialdehyde dehydrogenase [Shewanella sp. MMG014]|uniref:glutamate-5-semialdehyde dehydrogenase n=1 Tax=Shewanella sp. MMG014 TaxID=2822691 RepID=UPI001B375F1C|nr:glutamate-5-semialdehyde dehydrogenase [Shewanella sp. MMG014]MBQ4888723.1 glutamate-5-semialdehyde dehydrogenase [Shewanella sp. MMG014]
MNLITDIAKQASQASRSLVNLDTETKNHILNVMAAELRNAVTTILEANQLDMDNAKQNNLASAMQDRLLLNEQRIELMAKGLEEVALLPDPVGKIRDLGEQPNGIKISKMRIPLGVVCMIYEARPNVTADAGALCFKSGNAIILRGGKEALHSSKAIASILQKTLVKFDLPEALISVVPNADRALLMDLMQQREYIDVIIPRGGEGLINFVTDNSKVPVIQHFKGVCHLYIDKYADFEKAIKLLLNGKTQRTGVCNALEGLIVHKAILNDFMPLVAKHMAEQNVLINACQTSLPFFNQAQLLQDDQFGTEYLDLEIAVKTVDSLNGALDHIHQFGSNHTEVICTEDKQRGELFQRSVDASVVMVNASSRFSDGSQLGLGAEIGIATTKLHAYGPMGLESLTAEKFLVSGDGQVRD